MTRIDELEKRYPSVPRDVGVKLEVVNRGSRDTGDLEKVSVWKPPFSSYQSQDHDVALNDLLASGKVKQRSVLRPSAFYMKSGLD